MTEIELSEGSIEAIARRVVELLEERPGAPGLVDAAELARRLGVTRAWVYEHATELGAIRLGGGQSPRLRFDPAEAVAAMTACAARAACASDHPPTESDGVVARTARPAPAHSHATLRSQIETSAHLIATAERSIAAPIALLAEVVG